MPIYMVTVDGHESPRLVKAMTGAGARNFVAKEIVTATQIDAEKAFELGCEGVKLEDATTES